MSRLSRKEKRKLRQDGVLDQNADFNPKSFSVRKDISPMTEAQADAFSSWKEDYNLMLHGIAGTGKTFLALYFAVSDVFNKDTPYKKVFIVRSTVPSRNQGFMPGTKAQKEAVYEQPYGPICSEIFGRGDAYQVLKQKNSIEFLSTSFLRGSTFDNCVIVVDEMQNMSAQELHTVMTRVGQNCKIIFAGDIKQDDLTSERFNEESGIADFIKIIDSMSQFDLVEFFAEDIVRSELVKEYIIMRDKLGL